MRYTRAFRLGWGRAGWEIRFAFVPRMVMIGIGWDDPDPRPWMRRTCSVHLPCVAVVIQRPQETIDPDAVTAWLHDNVDRK